MDKKFSTQQRLVLITASIALLLIAGAATYQSLILSKPIPVTVEGHPQVGSPEAKIGLVLIEDFRCCACKTFNEEVLPQIESRFIETGEVYFVLVPVAFLHGSKPLANAALAVYKLAPSQFFPYARAIFKTFSEREIDGSEREELLELARFIGGIDLVKLKEYIESNSFFSQLDQNLDWAKRIMGKDFGAPALYINGTQVSTVSFEMIAQKIERLRNRI